MNKIYYNDIAILAFQPIIDLAHSPFATLSSHAALHWLNSDCFSSQWGAFMHFYGPTRKLLKIGGLALEDENFLNIVSSNKKWNFLISNYLNNTLDIQTQLYLIRLLFYLGFYEQGLQLCEKVINESEQPEEKIWGTYLQEFGKSINDPIFWSPINFMKKVAVFDHEVSSFLLFHIYLLFAKFFIRNSNDIDAARTWLDKASVLIENSELSKNVLDLNLARLRLFKYRADFYFRYENMHEAQALLSYACNLSDDSIEKLSKDSPFLYLFKETKRRILDALILYYYRSAKNQKKSLQYAQESCQIDPYCSYALTLAGKMAANIDRELSNSYFEKAAQYGVLERPYAKQILANQLHGISLSRKNDLITEALEGAIFLIPETGCPKASIEKLKLPIEMKSLQKIVKNYSKDAHWEQIKKADVYQRFLPFWELKLSQLACPIFCSAPLVALEVVKNKAVPWFKTLYLQRAMPVNFREELFFAVSPHSHFSILHQSLATKLEILQARSEEADHILSTYRSIDALSKLDRILFCRLLGSLGFYEEALRKLPVPDCNIQWHHEDEYAACTKLFLEHIYYAGTDLFPYQDIEFVFEKLSKQPKSLRMRLVLTMLGLVYHGKRKNIPALKKWRERGFEALILIQNNQYFDEFEKKLLTSRFYRAASFYPFLMNEANTLRREAELCESFARSLTPQNETHKLILKENLFPMLESMSKIYTHLGEVEIALSLMEEIVKKVDPLDAKAWIQVGEIREKNGDLEKALEAFQTAGCIGVPLGKIAWYRAGRTAEKIGDLYNAKHYYLRSLKFCPKGLSPLKRLLSIAKELDDHYLQTWSEVNLATLRECFGSVARS